MRCFVYGITDVGRRREANQDHFLIDESIGLFAIADGMGGHAAGEVASEIAIQTLAETLRRNDSTNDTVVDEAGRRLVHAVHEGNRRICESVVTREEWRGMGTTIVAMLKLNDRAVIGHVGDSRAYRVRAGKLERLTTDHSWVGEQVRLGLLTDEEASRHPMRNIVTRALGNRQEVEVELKEEACVEGDTIMLCSDGLNSMLTDVEILETLTRHADNPEAACKGLVDRANACGGEDNITVIVVSCRATE
ncbi:MAG: Stp1/IreP family PP2C-type Ser/Thr phosphatase [bacterium]|nr:Stp1/IreP family PP2C-type Ser/Thr phosphatase [bacterium]